MHTEAILRILENGKWHRLEEISKKTHLNSDDVETVAKFLAKYSFVTMDEAEQKVKLDTPTTKFFQRLNELENEEDQ
jgi:DNA-binding IclR family transcriptional regulator